MTYSFRLRFNLPDTLSLNILSSEWLLDENDTIHNIKLKSLKKVKSKNEAVDKLKEVGIKDSTEIVLTGGGYSSEEEALSTGEKYKDRLIFAFSLLNIGVDFGDNATESGITENGLRYLEEVFGCSRALPDRHGLMAYTTDPEPDGFLSVCCNFSILKPTDMTINTLSHALNNEVSLTEEIRLAYNLFSASFFQSRSPESRFLLLMMAIETLIQQDPRDEKVKCYVDKLILKTEVSRLPKQEKKSIIGSLNWLYIDSIRQAGFKLMACLGEKKYIVGTPGNLESPKKIFDTAYEIRNDLVHGHHPRRSRDIVGRYAAVLETLVSDLLITSIQNNNLESISSNGE